MGQRASPKRSNIDVDRRFIEYGESRTFFLIHTRKGLTDDPHERIEMI